MSQNLSALIGDDNVLKLKNLTKASVFLKLESLNPAGSIKFKTAIGLIDALEESNAIGPDSILIESSSGNLGVALSVICAERGYRFACVVDPNVNIQNVRYMAALGATIIKVTAKDANGGFLGSRIACIRSLVAKDPRYIWINQYENPANPAIHAHLTAQAIERNFARIDYLFIGAGTCGTLMGCVRQITRTRPTTKIIAVDSLGSVTFGLPPDQRYIPGLGSSQESKLFRRDDLHALIAVPEAAAVSACRFLARTHGLLAGGSTGTVLAGLWHCREWFSPGDVVVAIAPDGGERYLETIYSDEWVVRRFGEGALVAEIDSPAVRRCTTILQQANSKELQHV